MVRLSVEKHFGSAAIPQMVCRGKFLVQQQQTNSLRQHTEAQLFSIGKSVAHQAKKGSHTPTAKQTSRSGGR